jgi:hypothetical protein
LDKKKEKKRENKGYPLPCLLEIENYKILMKQNKKISLTGRLIMLYNMVASIVLRALNDPARRYYAVLFIPSRN